MTRPDAEELLDELEQCGHAVSVCYSQLFGWGVIPEPGPLQDDFTELYADMGGEG